MKPPDNSLGQLLPISRIEFCEWAARQDVDHCVEWPFATFLNGYGHIKNTGEGTTAHRVVLIMTSGNSLSPDHITAHEPVVFHNRLRVNPKHLRWATTKENSDDRLLDATAI